MKVLIIGGTRGIGYALTTLLAGEGDITTTVLARNPEKINAEFTQVRVIKGSAADGSTMQSAMKDQDAVVSCIGVPITFKPVTLFSTAASHLVSYGTPEQKIICVTGIGAGDTKSHGGFLYDKIFKPLLLKTIYEDKDREEEIIRTSSLNWQIIRPAGLTNGKRTGKYKIITDLAGITSRWISRRDVADYILKELRNPSHFGQTPLLTY